MPGGLSGLLVIIGLVWWIVSAIVSASTKKQEQQRLEELARRRREQARQMTGQSDSGPAGQQASPRRAVAGPAAPQVSPREARVEDLRRRRDAQLEELRRRRQQPRQQQARTGTTPKQAPPPARPVPPATRPKTAHPTPKPPARQPKVARSSGHLADHHIETRVDSHVGEAMRARQMTTRVGSKARQEPVSQPSTSTDDLRAGLKDRRALRQAFVLKEILDAPLALR